MNANQEAGVLFPQGMLLGARLWLVIGWPVDVLFNWSWGAWIFREWRGITFSSHIQSRVDRGLWDAHTVMWATFLNCAAPNHGPDERPSVCFRTELRGSGV